MAFNVGSCVVIDSNRNINAGIGTFTQLNVPPIAIAFDPTDEATLVRVDKIITITFNQPIKKGTGNITLRSGSAGGTILQTIAVSNAAVTISGAVVTINPPSLLAATTDIYVVVDAGAFTSISFSSPNPIINTYNFTTQEDPALGESFEGGFVICKDSVVRWIVAPSSSEVTRNWYSRGDANTRAQQVSGCTGWFIPTVGQLQNPGYVCRSFWDSFSTAYYWSSTENLVDSACRVGFNGGSASLSGKQNTFSVRAFRCVTY